MPAGPTLVSYSLSTLTFVSQKLLLQVSLLQCQPMKEAGSGLALLHAGYTGQGRNGTPVDREAWTLAAGGAGLAGSSGSGHASSHGLGVVAGDSLFLGSLASRPSY